MNGAAIIFFAYLGYDAVATLAEEVCVDHTPEALCACMLSWCSCCAYIDPPSCSYLQHGILKSCAASPQAKNPSRDMPIGIIGATTVCTVLYIIMCIVSPSQHLDITIAAVVHHHALLRPTQLTKPLGWRPQPTGATN